MKVCFWNVGSGSFLFGGSVFQHLRSVRTNRWCIDVLPDPFRPMGGDVSPQVPRPTHWEAGEESRGVRRGSDGLVFEPLGMRRASFGAECGDARTNLLPRTYSNPFWRAKHQENFCVVCRTLSVVSEACFLVMVDVVVVVLKLSRGKHLSSLGFENKFVRVHTYQAVYPESATYACIEG